MLSYVVKTAYAEAHKTKSLLVKNARKYRRKGLLDCVN